MKPIKGTSSHTLKITREDRGHPQTRDTVKILIQDGAVEVHCSSTEGKDKKEFNTTFNLGDFSDFAQGLAGLCESVVTREME